MDQTGKEQVEVAVGDVIVTKCPSGMCALFGRNNHEYIVLGVDTVEGHKLASAAQGFLPMKDLFLVGRNKVWSERGTMEIVVIKKGAGSETVARYKEYQKRVEWAHENGISEERFLELCESERPLLDLVDALVTGGDLLATSEIAVAVLNLAGIDADERQKLIVGTAFSVLTREYEKQLARQELRSLVSGPFGGAGIASLGDIIGIGLGFPDLTQPGGEREADASSADTATTEEAPTS